MGFVPNWLVPASFSEVAVTVPVFGSMALTVLPVRT